jgi:peptide/nickel transport system substrate-binding protein
MSHAVVKTAMGAVTALALVATGCGGGPTGDGGPTGGTLRIIGSSDVEHLDTAAANSVGGYALNRTHARTLFGTKASNHFAETVPLRADLAVEVPTRQNGGISKDGKTYTVRLRPGVRWNSRPSRPVVAADFVRGLKRLCNPAAPSGGLGYYRSTIRGMGGYCDGYAKVDGKDPQAMAAYQNAHDIPGVTAKDDATLVFHLTRRAGDFLNLLALQFAAPAPAEYDAYIPDSPELRANTIATGPYQISRYSPNRFYELTRNPVWRQETDPLRGQFVDRISITLGQDSPDAVQQQLEHGTADLAWDQPVPIPALARLRRAHDPRLAIRQTPSNSPYLVFNTRSPGNGGALAKPQVRRAIQYAVDRAALAAIFGGPEIARPLHTVIPPGNLGHLKYNLYPTPGDVGDPSQCRHLLAEAGYPDGLKVRFPYRTNGHHRRVAESLKENLRGCGIEATLIPDSNGNFYARTLMSPDAARAGAWDIAAPGWTPDWYGNNGRSTIQPLFDGRLYGRNSTNYGGYANPAVNKLIDQALEAPDADRAARFWHQADRMIMKDAAIVPLLDRAYPIFGSTRLRGARFVPTTATYDYTQIWLGEHSS